MAATKEHGERVDYEYERNGTASIFMFAEPLSGFRQATAREQRTKVDWAIEVAHLLDTRYAGCAQITLVCDNLNTHTKGAFYTAFPAELARASGCALLPAYLPRTERGYAARLLPEIPYDRPALRSRESRHKLTQEIMRAFEPAIRQHPDQWYHFVSIWH